MMNIDVDITPILHALCAVVAQVLVGLFTGNWAYGAIAGCTFFIAREHPGRISLDRKVWERETYQHAVVGRF